MVYKEYAFPNQL